MNDRITSRKVTASEIENLLQPLADDLHSAYKIMEESCHDVIQQAKREGWTEEQLIKEIENLFGE